MCVLGEQTVCPPLTSFRCLFSKNRTDGHAGQYLSACNSSAGDASTNDLASCCLESNDELLMSLRSLTSLSLPSTLLISAPSSVTAWTIPFIRLVFPPSSFLVHPLEHVCIIWCLPFLWNFCTVLFLQPEDENSVKWTFTNYVIPNYIYIFTFLAVSKGPLPLPINHFFFFKIFSKWLALLSFPLFPALPSVRL